MRATIISTALLAPLATLAAPSSHHDKIKMNLSTRQNASLTKPAPCVPAVPAPSEAETEARFDKFANAFIVTKNITEAIEYITESYIVSHPSLVSLKEGDLTRHEIEPQPLSSKWLGPGVGPSQSYLGRSKYHGFGNEVY